jgi:two-component system OmpR family response regulator
MRLLLVEDDPMIGEALCVALRDAAWSVDWVREGKAARAALRPAEHDAVLLDLSLPGHDGLEVLRESRAARNATPVIIVTARDALADRVAGLDAGADDYVTKPFDMPELLARLRAVIRRRAGPATPVLSNGILTLDPATHEATREGEARVLTPREFALLHALMVRPGAILSRAQLEQSIYAWDEPVESNTIDFLIHAVRRKLGADAIRNVRGAGWVVDKRA